MAGPLALAACSLLVVAEVAMWPFDPQDHLATTRNVVFQVASAVWPEDGSSSGRRQSSA